MNVTKLPQRSELHESVPARLREIADKVEKGEVTQLMIACVENGEYTMWFPSSIHNTIVLATLAHRRAVDHCMLP